MTIEINRSNNSDIDGILWGWAWGNGGSETLTFSFPTSAAEYTGYAAVNGFSSFNTAQAAAVRDGLANIASFCNLTFIETAAPGAALRYAEATSVNYTNNSSVARLTGLLTVDTAMGGPPELVFGGAPPLIPTYAQGDSWFNTSLYDSPLFGGYSYQTIMHETGHSLGLKHGHVTQVGHGITFPTLPANHDSQEYSVMTYRQFPGDNPLNSYNNPDFPTTYMQDDIAALQYLYGANYGPSAHNGDTVYTWSPTTGQASIDGIGQGVPWHNFVFMTIWDGGGIDTYDFSNYTTNLRVDLNPGKWTVLDTSVAHAQLADLGNNGAGGPEYFARGNIANALTDPNNPSETLSLIENAVGGTGHDTLIGNGIGNTLRGNDGNDQLYGMGGADTMDGGHGDDIYVVTDVGDVAAESSNGVGSGYDLVFSSVNYTLGFGIEDLVLEGLAANGTGNTEDNYITGNSAMNVLSGLDGNDILSGYEGNDTLLGGNGTDSLDGFTGDDVLNGGAGTDKAWYGSATAGVAVNLSIGIAQNTLGAGIDTLVSIENLTGSDFNDTLTGNSGNNVLTGGLGHDTLDGGSGADTMYGDAGADFYIVDNAGDTAVESDELFGGNDTVYSTVSFTLGLGLERLDLGGMAAINGIGNRFGNEIHGNDANNVLSGLDGFDYLYGGNGNDRLNGGTGADWMEGNSGNDTYYVDSVYDVVSDYGSFLDGGGVDLVYTSISYALTPGEGIEHLTLTGTAGITGAGNELNNIIIGNSANNILSGLDGNDTLTGGSGNDTLTGGAGTDTASYATAAAGVTVNVALAGAQNTVGAGTDTLSSIEHVVGSAFNDTLTGNAGNNTLTGGNGNDTLNGGSGNDTLIGGLGLDTLTGGLGNDRFDYNAVTESPVGTGRDKIVGFVGNGTLVGDQIDLRDIDANVLLSSNQAFTYIGGAAFTAAGQLRYAGGILQGSTDADVAAEFEIQLVGTPALVVGGTGTDILL